VQKKPQPTPTETGSSGTTGLTIQEFLTRYPEVKRLSSRFNDDGKDIAGGKPIKSVTSKPRKQKEINNKHNKQFKKQQQQQQNQLQSQQKNIFFNQVNSNPTSSPKRPIITPKQRKVNKPPKQPVTARTTTTRRTTRRTTRKPLPKKPQPTKPTTLVTQITNNHNDYDANYDYEANYDYDYYYDQLVPEHERFFQLPKLTSTTPSPDIGGKKVTQNHSFQFFSQLAADNRAPKPTQPSKQKSHKSNKQKGGNRGPKSQSSPKKQNSIAPPAPKPGTHSGPNSGPFGYVEKGTYFIDSESEGFPESMQIIYQGFIWAMEIKYPGQGDVNHGGVHTILEDKVKRETVNLRDDHIVRVTGRASPYNINRLTFYTAKGKQYGPWGDRRSKESVDFDVTAPPGHGLGFLSGTIDFGVPLRSVSFHWRPIA